MMRRFGLPVLPLVIGVMLGPQIERRLRQSLQLGGGDWTSLFIEPVAIVVGYTADRFGEVAVEHRLAEAKGPGTGPSDRQLDRGNSHVYAADALLTAMEPDDAELPVIGLRHRSPVGKLLPGSVFSRYWWNALTRCWPSNRTRADRSPSGEHVLADLLGDPHR